MRAKPVSVTKQRVHSCELTAEEHHLAGCPVDPPFAIGVDVEQNQTLHQVREDQLNGEGTN